MNSAAPDTGSTFASKMLTTSSNKAGYSLKPHSAHRKRGLTCSVENLVVLAKQRQFEVRTEMSEDQ
jgi:hypothetical protein